MVSITIPVLKSCLKEEKSHLIKELALLPGHFCDRHKTCLPWERQIRARQSGMGMSSSNIPGWAGPSGPLCANRSLPGLGSSGKGAGNLQILPKHALPRLLPLRLRKPKDADKTRLSLTTNSLLSTPCRVSFDTTTEVHLYSQSSDWPTERTRRII